jgi:hypothetical protein
MDVFPRAYNCLIRFVTYCSKKLRGEVTHRRLLTMQNLHRKIKTLYQRKGRTIKSLYTMLMLNEADVTNVLRSLAPKS